MMSTCLILVFQVAAVGVYACKSVGRVPMSKTIFADKEHTFMIT